MCCILRNHFKTIWPGPHPHCYTVSYLYHNVKESLQAGYCSSLGWLNACDEVISPQPVQTPHELTMSPLYCCSDDEVSRLEMWSAVLHHCCQEMWTSNMATRGCITMYVTEVNVRKTCLEFNTFSKYLDCSLSFAYLHFLLSICSLVCTFRCSEVSNDALHTISMNFSLPTTNENGKSTLLD